ncbi:MAG TPA: hypothetical protein VGC95_06560 [Chitinophagaceae bacterium]|jgi:septal ring factor EnvC (AmiA/AmiB activator)
MKNDILYNSTSLENDTSLLRTLKQIEQKLEKGIAGREDVIRWQHEELKRLQHELSEKSSVITHLNTKLIECGSQSEGNRQLINKLINDIDRLSKDVEWYKRTYETRSLFGVVKDKLKHYFS